MKLYCIICSFILFWRLTPAFAQNVEISPDDTLKFDQVYIDSSKILPIDVKNTGPSQIRIGDLTFLGSSSSYDIVQYDTARFDSGETRNIDIRFSPNIIGPIYDSLQIQIIIIGPQPDTVITVQLYGEGLAPKIVTDFDTLHFGAIIVNNPENKTIQIQNQGNASLQVYSAEISDTTHFHLISDPIQTIPQGGSGSLQVSFVPISRGNFNATLTIFNNDPRNEEMQIVLSGIGIIEGVIDVQPSSLDFDSVAVNDDTTNTLTIFNLGDISLAINSIVFNVGIDFTYSGTQQFSINPSDSRDIQIQFKPLSVGPKEDILIIYSQDNDSVTIPLTGIGVIPQIQINPLELDFGQVLLSEERILSIEVHNQGEADLVFFSELVFGNQFNRLGSADLITVKRGLTHEIAIRFRPLSRETYADTLRIVNNDPQNPILKVPLHGRGIIAPKIDVEETSINFGKIVINSESVINFTITNEGDQDLIIDTEMTGLEAGIDFSLGIYQSEVGGGETIIVPIKFLPDSVGIKSDELRIFSNDQQNPRVDIDLSGEGIDLFCRIDYPDSAEFEKTFPIEVEICSNINIVVADLKAEYTEGGSFIWNQQTMNQDSDRIWTTQIESQEITEKGFKFRFIATGNDANTYHSPEFFIRVVIPPNTYEYNFTPLRKDRWIMFSIPFTAIETQIDTILSDLGSEGSTTWKIYRTDSSGISENYYDYDSLKIMGNYGKFETGNAFWLYLKKVNTDRILFPKLYTIKEDCTFTYPLQPGWNQIGSPFNFQISWLDDIRSNFPDQLAIYHYESGASNNGWNNDLVDDEDFDLSPWDGYAVYNDSTVGSSLIFDIGNQNNVSSTLLRKSSNVTWKLIFSTKSSGAFSKNAIGMSPLAKSNRDNLDYVNPPIIGDEYVSSYFSHPEWKKKIINYCTDFCPVNESGDRWDFTIQSSSRTVRFSVLEMDQLPPYFNIKLVDSKLGLSYDINSSESIKLNEIQMDEINRFVLLVGDEQYIKTEENKIERFLPKTYVLQQNYPNPFNPGTFIYFEIPEAADVNLSIYNILGQKIMTLVNDFKTSGSYRILWDGTDDKGREVASGIYFYRLTSNRFEKTLKMLKIQ